MIEISLEQQKQIQKDLSKLSDALQTKALRSGLVKAAAPIKKTAKALAPVHQIEEGEKYHRTPGTMRDAIGHKTLTKQEAANLVLIQGGSRRTSIKNPGLSIIIGPNRKVDGHHQGFIGSLMEFGVESGQKAGRKRSFFSRGFKAKPYLTPALNLHQGQMQPRFYQGMANYLNRMK